MTAHATPRRSCEALASLAAIATLAFACTRSPRKQPTAEPSLTPMRSTSVPAARASTGAADGDVAAALVSLDRGCLAGLDDKLDADRWFEAAARACQPGSSRSGDVLVKKLSHSAPATIDVPEQLRSHCFTAFAIADPRALPISMEILDADGRSQSVVVLTSSRNAIPNSGPLCSLSGRLQRLTFRPASSSDVQMSLAFYSVDGPHP